MMLVIAIFEPVVLKRKCKSVHSRTLKRSEQVYGVETRDPLASRAQVCGAWQVGWKQKTNVKAIHI